jgi:hypothetical protein
MAIKNNAPKKAPMAKIQEKGAGITQLDGRKRPYWPMDYVRMNE